MSPSPHSTISPAAHHGDAMAQHPHDVQVVGDEEIGDSRPRLHFEEQFEDARLGRQVEGRDRLVADDQPRLEGDGSCDRDALALAAAELARQAVSGIRGQVNEVEQVAHPAGSILRADAAGAQRLCQRVADGQRRAERRVGILEDDLEVDGQFDVAARGRRGRCLRRRG